MKNKLTLYTEVVSLIIISVLTVIFLISQEIFEDGLSYRHPEVFYVNTGVSYVSDDGSLVPLETDNMYYTYEDAKADMDNTIQFTLPRLEEDDQAIALYTNDNDVTVYIDGVERGSYSDEEYRLIGSYSSAGYLRLPLTKADSGKTVRVVYRTTLDTRCSTWGVPVIGTQTALLCWALYRNSWIILSGFLLIAVGIIFIILGLVTKLGGYYTRGIWYLGVFSIMMALWLLCQSEVRALYFTHLNTANFMGIISLALAPIPMFLYFNALLNYEFQSLYCGAIGVCIANVAMCIFIEFVLGLDAEEFLMPTHVIVVATCIIILVTFLKCSAKERIAKSWAVLIGILGFIATTIVEDANLLIFNRYLSGNYVGFGMLIFLLSLGYSGISGMEAQEKMYETAIRENTEKTTFLANMSHEIRTPINTILGMNEMILRECDDEEIRRYAVNIRSSGRLLLSLVNDVLDFTKLEAGKLKLSPATYETAEFLNDVINSTNIRAAEKGLEVELDIEENIPSVLYGDELKLRQAFGNIVTNAIKYTEKGTVSIIVHAVWISAAQVRLDLLVKDTGIGIKKEDIDKLFDSFVRLDTNRNRRVEGTGLGLAITKQMVDMLGGELGVDSEYGVGSTFSISVIQKVVDATPIGNFARWHKVTEGNTDKYIERFDASEVSILVVDDNDMNLEVIKALLKKTHINIDTALSGQECLDKVAVKDYDVIFLDHMMPGMDGVETLHRLETLSPDTPVVALTANAMSGSRQEYLGYGFDEYLAKPVDYMGLMKIIIGFVPDKVTKTTELENMEKGYSKYLEENGIHMSSALKYAGDDVEQYIHLLQMFSSKRGQERIKVIEKCQEESNWEDYTTHVHGLKNSARTIGADELADMAHVHELKSKNGDYDYVRHNFNKFIEKWNKDILIVEGFLAKRVELRGGDEVHTDTIKAPSVDMEQIEKYLQAFKKKDALNAIKMALSATDIDDNTKEKLEAAKEAVENYDYEEALRVIKGKH